MIKVMQFEERKLLLQHIGRQNSIRLSQRRGNGKAPDRPYRGDRACGERVSGGTVHDGQRNAVFHFRADVEDSDER